MTETDLENRIGTDAAKRFAKQAEKEGVTVEELEAKAKRWYLEQAEKKLKSDPKDTLILISK